MTAVVSDPILDLLEPDVRAFIERLPQEQRYELISLYTLEARKEVPHPMDQWDNASDWAQDCVIWREGEGLSEYQIEIMERIESEKKVCLRGPHTIGKCLAYGESVRLADGTRVAAESLIGKSFAVRSVDPDLGVRESRAFAFDNGVRDIIELETDKGRVIRRTVNHPLWADASPVKYSKPEYANRTRPVGAWVKAGDLAIGSTVAVYLGGNEADTEPYTDGEIAIVAYLIGDGGLTGRAVKFSQEPGVSLDEFKAECEKLGSRVEYDRGCDYRVSGYGGVNPVLTLVRRSGIMGEDSFSKRIPEWVFRLSDRRMAIFLSRLYSTDGWACVSTNYEAAQIGYTSVSEGLARDVQSALLQMGVQASLQLRKTGWVHNGEKRSGFAWNVYIGSVPDILTFCDRIGIHGKTAQLSEVRHRIELSDPGKVEKWRTHALPANMRWEKVRRTKLVRGVPTVGITVPGDATFVTDFVEHNTATSSLVVLFYALKWEADASRGRIRNWVIVTTAGYWVQVEKYLWAGIHMWSRSINWEKCGHTPFKRHVQLLDTELKLEYGRAFGVANENLEGAHADRVLYVTDEMKDIPDSTYEKMEGALAGAGEDTIQKAYVFGASTPGDKAGKLYNIHARKPGHTDWYPIHVTAERAMAAGRMSRSWYNARKLEWGENSAVFKRRARGEFASEDATGLIPLAWIEAANVRYLEREAAGDIAELQQVGADIAEGGEDRTVFAPRFGTDFVDRLHSYHHTTPLVTGDRLFRVLSQLGGRVLVDILPSGTAIAEYLDRLGVEARVFNGSERASYFLDGKEIFYTDRSGTFRFQNRRSHAYWHLREMLDPSLEPPPTLALPPDDPSDTRTLTGDLSAPAFMRTGSIIRVEAKEDFAKRLGHSPDKGDATAMACYPWDDRKPTGDTIGGSGGFVIGAASKPQRDTLGDYID